MSSDTNTANTDRRSTAVIAVDLQNTNQAVGDGLQLLCNTAGAILDSEAPTKRLRKSLLDTAHSLLELQSNVVSEIPNLITQDCAKYSIKRISTAVSHQTKTLQNQFVVLPNLRQRIFKIGDAEIPLPANQVQYTAAEACAILLQIELNNSLTLNKTVKAMIKYKSSPTTEVTPLIPCGRSSMFCILTKFWLDPNVRWPSIGQPPILSNDKFLASIHDFERDKGRAVGKEDLNSILKDAKVKEAQKQGSSIMLVCYPSICSVNTYLNLLTQLDGSRSTTNTVQKKSEAGYIAEHSVRNTVSHIMW